MRISDWSSDVCSSDLARSALAAMNGQLASTPSSLAMPGVNGGGNPYASAQAELAGAQARGWTDSHPDVIALKRQIANLKSMGTAGSGGSTPNPAYNSIRSKQAEKQAMGAAPSPRTAAHATIGRTTGTASGGQYGGHPV